MDLDYVRNLTPSDWIGFDELDLGMLVNKTIASMRVDIFNEHISPGPQILFKYSDHSSLIVGGTGANVPADTGELALLYYDGSKYYWNILQNDGIEAFPKNFPKPLQPKSL